MRENFLNGILPLPLISFLQMSDVDSDYDDTCILELIGSKFIWDEIFDILSENLDERICRRLIVEFLELKHLKDSKLLKEEWVISVDKKGNFTRYKRKIT